jgi:hypothetical protein
MQQKVFWHPVSLKRFEVFTGARVRRLFVLVDLLGCDGILLVLRGRNGSVLDAGMMEQRMAMRFGLLYLISLPVRESSWISRLREASQTFDRDIGSAQTSTCHGSQRSKSVWVRKRPWTGHAEVPDLERESTGRNRHLD